jgi:alginate O-acetyltransferase complex protein AlgI
MLFNSFIFWIFLSILLPIYTKLRSSMLQKILLLLFSLFFYSYWEWKWTFILLFSIIFNYYLGKAFEVLPNQKKAILTFGIVINLCLLAVFKYYNFFIENIHFFSKQFSWDISVKTVSIILPIGISFYTFHAIGYLVDIYRNDSKPSSSIIDFGLYMCFFPFLIAGPIVRAKHFLPQLEQKKQFNSAHWQEGFYLIAIGLFQKVMIGDACGRIVDAIFYDFSKYTFFEIVCATLLFSFQIYADFAGYSNMARGLGKFFGIDLMQNFSQPYFSKNVKEFWSRWHISLSSWLRDYLYIPLGGNKMGKMTTFRNLIIVMTLGGLWHGAGWNFILWGLFHGMLLVAYNHFKCSFKSSILNIATTFILVTIGWFLFRISSLVQIVELYEKFLVFEFGHFPWRYLKMILSFGFVLFGIDWLQLHYNSDAFFVKFKNKALVSGIIFSMLLISFLYIFIKKPLPFIYFQF